MLKKYIRLTIFYLIWEESTDVHNTAVKSSLLTKALRQADGEPLTLQTLETTPNVTYRTTAGQAAVLRVCSMLLTPLPSAADCYPTLHDPCDMELLLLAEGH